MEHLSSKDALLKKKVSKSQSICSINWGIILIFLSITTANAASTNDTQAAMNEMGIVPTEGQLAVFNVNHQVQFNLPIIASTVTKSRKGRFGIQGSILNSRNQNGCGDMSSYGHPSYQWFLTKFHLPFIALVARGGCDYATKLRFASQAGVELIIFDADNSTLSKDDLKMFQSSIIPIVLVDETYANHLRKYTEGTGCIVGIAIFDEEPPRYEFENTFALLTLLLGIWLVVVSVKVATYVFVIEPMLKKMGSAWKSILLRNGLNSLSVIKWNMELKSKHETCCICLSDYIDEEEIRVMKCSHGYHKACIDTWLSVSKKPFCPLCHSKFDYQSFGNQIRELTRLCLSRNRRGEDTITTV